MPRLYSYELSQEADRDLEDIFDYTLEAFGLDQAVSYVSGFDDVFVMLAGNPEAGRRRPEIRAGLRSFVRDHHVVFYRVMKGRIRIVRVLHGARDIVRFL